MPAEECITGSDAAGRAKSVSSEKQIEYNLSRNKDKSWKETKEEQARGSVCNELTKNFIYREKVKMEMKK